MPCIRNSNIEIVVWISFLLDFDNDNQIEISIRLEKFVFLVCFVTGLDILYFGVYYETLEKMHVSIFKPVASTVSPRVSCRKCHVKCFGLRTQNSYFNKKPSNISQNTYKFPFSTFSAMAFELKHSCY